MKSDLKNQILKKGYSHWKRENSIAIWVHDLLLFNGKKSKNTKI